VTQLARDTADATIRSRFDPKRNSVNAVRFGLAVLVMVSHSVTLGGGTDPLGAVTGGVVDLGTVAVDGFFVLSGFLIANSFVRTRSVWRYFWHRCVRILPGFWVCLAVSALVLLPLAHLLQYATLTGFPLTGADSALSYVGRNAALFIDQFSVRGLLDGQAVNGSLYTLFYEFLCYFGLAALGLVGALTGRRWVTMTVAVLIWIAVLADFLTGGQLSAASVTLWLLFRLGLMFITGVLLWMCADIVPVNWRFDLAAAAVLTAAVVTAGWQGADPESRLIYLMVAPAAVAYLVLRTGSSGWLHRIGRTRDLSYGIYVYAWPVQILLLLVGGGSWPLVGYFSASLVVTLGFAWLSWTFIESPALRLKSWTPRRKPGHR
jgi:peptidoglycan/LPS O-acetylase OafA/YrhL